MARIVAKNAVIFAQGRDVSGRHNNATLSLSSEFPEVTTFGEGNRTRLSGGIKDVEFSADGFWDAAASQVDVHYNSLLTASGVYTLAPNGAGASKSAYCFGGIMTAYEVSLALEDAAAVSITVSGCTPLQRTKSLGYATAATDTASAVLGACTIDFTASQAGTVWGFIQLVSLTGTNGEISACLQDSPDDSTYTTELVFTTTSLAAVATALSGSISTASRYMRLKYILAGTSPCAAFAAFATTSV